MRERIRNRAEKEKNQQTHVITEQPLTDESWFFDPEVNIHLDQRERKQQWREREKAESEFEYLQDREQEELEEYAQDAEDDQELAELREAKKERKKERRLAQQDQLIAEQERWEEERLKAGGAGK